MSVHIEPARHIRRIVNCEQCGAEFRTRRARQDSLFCPKCREQRRKEYLKEYYRNRDKSRPPLDETTNLTRRPVTGDSVIAASDWGYRQLAMAVIRQALADARDGEEGALEWLETTGAEWMELLGLGIRPGEYKKALEKIGGENDRGRKEE
jgi:hypothetical protein